MKNIINEFDCARLMIVSLSIGSGSFGIDVN
jgi:hypothetical protein